MSKFVLSAVLVTILGGAAWQQFEAPARAPQRAAGAPEGPARAAEAPWHALSGTVSSVDVARGRLWLLADATNPPPLKTADRILQLKIDRATRLVRNARALALQRLQAGERVTVWYQPGARQYVRTIEILTPAGPG